MKALFMSKFDAFKNAEKPLFQDLKFTSLFNSMLLLKNTNFKEIIVWKYRKNDIKQVT